MKLFLISSYFVEYSHEQPASHVRRRQRGYRRPRLVGAGAGCPSTRQCETLPHGQDRAVLWHQRWRMFWMACAELFGYRDGSEWLVGHYRFVKP